MSSSGSVVKITSLIGFFICSFFLSENSQAQSPEFINYQAVARSTDTGQELINTDVSVIIRIWANGPQEDLVYEENHEKVTNQFGLFTLKIGGGTGDYVFTTIDWGVADHWLQVDIDAGEGFQTVSTTQLLSVPYALFAKSAGNVDDADSDPENEYNTAFNFEENNSTISITDQGGTHSLDLSSLKNDADADITNELNTDFNFNPTTGDLSISDNGSVLTQNLNALINDADADSTNELIDDFNFDEESGIISISENGSTFSNDLSSLKNDADFDPENELIDPESLELSEDFILSFTENGVTHSIDISAVSQDDDWLFNEETNSYYNNTNKFGIGTDSPVAKMEIKGNPAGTAPLLNVKNGSDAEVLTVRNNNKAGINISDPNSSFQVNGSYSGSVKFLNSASANSSYSVSENDQFIIVKFLSPGNYSLVLPEANSCMGRVYHIKKLGSIGTLNLEPMATDLIDGFNFSFPVGTNTATGQATVVSAGINGWVVFSEQ